MNMIMREAATLGRPTENKGICLQSLTLSEGTIRFEPEVTEYSINVAEDVTKILIKGITCEEDSYYTVSGNTNMVKGANEIVITVTDKDGNTGHYYIHVQVGKETEQATDKEIQQTSTAEQIIQGIDIDDWLSQGAKELDSFTKTVTSGNLRYVTYSVAGCGILAAMLWIAFFIKRAMTKHRYKKEGKARRARRKEQEKQWELAQTQQDILLRQVDELLEKKKKNAYDVPREKVQESDYDDYDDYEAYDEDDYYSDDDTEQELDRWLASFDEDDQQEDALYKDR